MALATWLAHAGAGAIVSAVVLSKRSLVSKRRVGQVRAGSPLGDGIRVSTP